MPQTLPAAREVTLVSGFSGASNRSGAVSASTQRRAQETQLSAEFDQTLRSKHALSSPRERADEASLQDPSARAAEKLTTADEGEGATGADEKAAELSEHEAETEAVNDQKAAEAVDEAHGGAGPAESDGATGADWDAATATEARAGDVAAGGVEATAPETIHALNEHLLRGLQVGVGSSGEAFRRSSLSSGNLANSLKREQIVEEREVDGVGRHAGAGEGTDEQVAGSETVGSSVERGRETGTDREAEFGEFKLRESAPEPSRRGEAAATNAASSGASARESAALVKANETVGRALDGRLAMAGRVGDERGQSARDQSRVESDRVVGADKPATVIGTERPDSGGAGAGRAALHGGKQAGASESPGQPGASGSGSAFAAQLARGLSAAIARSKASGAGNAQELTLRLQPAALGKVRIHVSFDSEQGQLKARFEVGSSTTRQLVQESLSTLREALGGRGVSVGKLDVEVDRSLSATAPSASDPLGLLFGTPNAESGKVDDPVTRFARAEIGPDGRGGEHDAPDSASSDNHGQSGPEARNEQGTGSTDAPSLPTSGSPSLREEDGAGARSVPETTHETGINELAERLADELLARVPGAAAARVVDSGRVRIDAVA